MGRKTVFVSQMESEQHSTLPNITLYWRNGYGSPFLSYAFFHWAVQYGTVCLQICVHAFCHDFHCQLNWTELKAHLALQPHNAFRCDLITEILHKVRTYEEYTRVIKHTHKHTHTYIWCEKKAFTLFPVPFFPLELRFFLQLLENCNTDRIT